MTRLWGTEPPTEPAFLSTTEPVARFSSERVMTPVNQVLTPAGQQVDLPELRPQALALSPDNQILVTAGKTAELVVISPTNGNILQQNLERARQLGR